MEDGVGVGDSIRTTKLLNDPRDMMTRTTAMEGGPGGTCSHSRRRRRRLPTPPPRILIVLPAAILLLSVTLLHHHGRNGLQELQHLQLVKRGVIEAAIDGATPADANHDIPSYIPYHEIYLNLPPVLGVTLLVLWLIFLFSFLGIVASDFFCPNLSTLSSRLGLPEDVAGATMVGWANGAPDLFSTFAALKAGSGSLAIGELIGAASFICSVVAGSMVLVKPFKVGKYNFWRDVGFFTIAVAFTLLILRDGHIKHWEAITMCGLYACYVAFVAVGSYWRRRRWRNKERQRLIREAWLESNVNESNDTTPYCDGGHEGNGVLEGPAAPPPVGDADESDDDDDDNDIRDLSASHDPRSLAPLSIPPFRFPNTTSQSSTPNDVRFVRREDDYFGPSRTQGSRAGSPSYSPRLAGLPSPAVATTSRHRAASSVSHHWQHHAPHPSLQVYPRHQGSGASTHSHSRSQSTHAMPIPTRMLHRSSILGAVEFRDVVNSLQAESSANRHLSAFGGLTGDGTDGGDDLSYNHQRRYMLGTRKQSADLENGSPLDGDRRRAQSLHGIIPSASSGTRQTSTSHPNRTRQKKKRSDGSAKSTTSATKEASPGLEDEENLGIPLATERRHRSSSNPTAPGHSELYQHYGNTSGAAALPADTSSTSTSGPEQTTPEFQVDDPWKGTPAPESRTASPPLIMVSRPTLVDWDEPSSNVAPGAGRRTDSAEDGDDTAGESDLTARPFQNQTSAAQRTPRNPSAMTRYPKKALRLLGVGQASSQADNGHLPPKAQRLLGLDQGGRTGPTAQTDETAPTSWEDLPDKTPTPSLRDRLRTSRAITLAILYAIFPSLHGFRHKSVLAMITSLISVPAVLMLNLTLPVVDESVSEEEVFEEKIMSDPGSEISSLAGDDGGDVSDGGTSERHAAVHYQRESPSRKLHQDDAGYFPHTLHGEEIEDILDEEEQEERDRNIRRTIAVAQELHSPVAASHLRRASISTGVHHPDQAYPHAHSHHLSTFLSSSPPQSPSLITSAIQSANRAASPVAMPAASTMASLPALEAEQELVVGDAIPYDVTDRDLTRYLTAIQCLLAPIFIVLALLGEELQIWYLPAATGVGMFLSTISILFFEDNHHVTRVLSLCSIGFIVAIVWILTIVNEVVAVLQTIGHVFGLSDAILGLTIFAMGNSLGDLVANVTVARMGYPLMALSACFGGPMLNILLGIGISGTYLTSKTGQPVFIQMSTTLFVSGGSLLLVLCGTLITVPLNGYVMSRKWAFGLILVYLAVMTANVVVEINSER